MRPSKRIRPPVGAGEIFLSMLAVALIFVHSRWFLRPFDDPKELVLYAGAAVFSLPILLSALRLPQPPRLNIITLPVILFCLYLPVNLLLARPPLNEGLAAAGKYILLAALFFALARLETPALVRIWKTLVWGGTLAALMVFLWPAAGVHQPPLGHISYQSDFFVLLIPWTGYFLAVERSRWRAWGLASAGILLTAVVIAGSRKTAMASLGASLFLLAMFVWIYGRAHLDNRALRHLLTAGIAGAVTVGLLALAQRSPLSPSADGPAGTPDSVFNRYEEMITEYRSWGPINIRFVIAQRALEAFATRPVQGLGYGSFRFAYPRFYRAGDREAAIFDAQSPHWLMHPHNEPLYQLFEGGLIGGVLTLVPPVLTAFFLARALRRRTAAPATACLTLATMLVLGITGMFNTSLMHPLLRFQSVLTLAMGYRLSCAELHHGAPLPAAARRARPVRWLAAAVIVLAALVVSGSLLAGYFVRQQRFAQAAWLAPRSYDVLSRHASYHMAAGRWSAAEELLATARVEFPAVPQILLKSVKVYLRQDKRDEARQLLQHAYGLYPFYHPIAELYHRHVTPE